MAAKRKDEDRRPSNLLLEGWKAEFCNYLETVDSKVLSASKHYILFFELEIYSFAIRFIF